MTKAEEVAVQTSDIEFIRDTLQNLYFMSVSLDLQDQYRRLDDRGSVSALTIQAEEALTKAKAAAELAVDESAPEPETKPEQGPNPIRAEGLGSGPSES